MSTEAEIQARILLALGARPDVRLFRNTVGEGWQGRVVARNRGTVTLQPGDVLIRAARYVTFGLAPGSPDLVGWRRRPTGVAQPLLLEVKTDSGKPSSQQHKFLDMAASFGCCAAVVRSAENAIAIVTVD